MPAASLHGLMKAQSGAPRTALLKTTEVMTELRRPLRSELALGGSTCAEHDRVGGQIYLFCMSSDLYLF